MFFNLAHYRRKLRSKLDTVKRQFSEQNSTSNIRRPPNSPATTFEDIGTFIYLRIHPSLHRILLGSGLNYALLTAQLAPALTKSYQQKMREWETMQKSQFLGRYPSLLIPPFDRYSSSQLSSTIDNTKIRSE